MDQSGRDMMLSAANEIDALRRVVADLEDRYRAGERQRELAINNVAAELRKWVYENARDETAHQPPETEAESTESPSVGGGEPKQ